MSYMINVSPHIRSKNATWKIMLDVIIALLPALFMSVIHYGFRPLLLVLVSVAASVLFEFLYEKIMKMPVTVQDLSAVVTGMLLAFNVPAGMPVWQLLVGDFFVIIVAKMLFGGLGRNFMNPALVGRVVMMFSFAVSMTTFITPAGTVDVFTSATPLAVKDTLSWNQFLPLFLGTYPGTIGETSAAALLLGGIYLCIRRVIKPIIPLFYIGSLILFTFLFGGSHPVLSVFAGGVFLGAVFMATDYVTSPITNWGKVLYGVFLGLVTALIRVFGNYAEGVTFAIILGNVITPYLNELTRPRPIGVEKKKQKEAKT